MKLILISHENHSDLQYDARIYAAWRIHMKLKRDIHIYPKRPTHMSEETNKSDIQMKLIHMRLIRIKLIHLKLIHMKLIHIICETHSYETHSYIIWNAFIYGPWISCAMCDESRPRISRAFSPMHEWRAQHFWSSASTPLSLAVLAECWVCLCVFCHFCWSLLTCV